MKNKKKEEYELPMYDLLEIAVEHGFAASAEMWKEEEISPDWDEYLTTEIDSEQ